MAPLLSGAAIQLGIEGIRGPEDFSDPGEKKERGARARLALEVVKAALERVATSCDSTLELSHRAEPFFLRARSKAHPYEFKSQEEAIAEYLGLDGGELILSERDLIHGALRAAVDLGKPAEFCMDDLIREGLRKVSQDLITTAVNQQNRKEELEPSSTVSGSRWDKYEEAYQKLQAELGTKAWSRRKPYITLSYIASECGSNVVQIGRWAEITGKRIVGKPDKDEDQTAGGLIVNDKR